MPAFAHKVALKRKFLFFAFLMVLFLGISTYKNSEKLSLWFAIHSEKPNWVKVQIAKDLALFSSITQDALDEIFQKARPFQTARYRTLNGKIYRLGTSHSLDRTKQFEKMLSRIQRSKQPPNTPNMFGGCFER